MDWEVGIEKWGLCGMRWWLKEGLFLSLKHLRNNIIGIISRIDNAKNNMAVATSAPPASGVLPVD